MSTIIYSRRAAIALAAVAFCASFPASAKETVSFGYLADPSHEAVLWPCVTARSNPT